MNTLLRRKLGVIAGLALLSAVAWAGHAATVPVATGSTELTPTAVTPSTNRLAITDFTEVAKAVTPAVVHITRIAEPAPTSGRHSRDPYRDRREWEEWMEKFFESPGAPPMPRAPHGPFNPWPWPWPRGPHSEGMGSGVILSPDGYILTNNHVVEGANTVTVTLPDEREFNGKIVGTDPKADLAVVKIEARGLASVPWGDSTKLEVGEPILAVGNPFGLTSTVTQGIVSALGRGRMGITQYEDFIQTDAAINPGNSGGALINTRGELVGINTAIFSRTGGYQGIGFAIPTSMARPVYESLVTHGRVVRGYLGIGIQDMTADLAESFEREEPTGALVGDVRKGSPADKAGIQRGDVIVRYDGKAVDDPLALQRMVTRTPVGRTTTITVARAGKEVDLSVTVGEQPGPIRTAQAKPDERKHALVGLAVKDLDERTARRLGLEEDIQGVVVVDVLPGSSADRAGLTRGDVIREVNRQPIGSTRDFEEIAADLEKDERLLLLVNRRGVTLFVSMKV